MTTEGGATVGYWAIGNLVMDTAPKTRMNRAITHAKMGRSMKKRDMLAPLYFDAAAEAAAVGTGAAPMPACALGCCHGTALTGALGFIIFWKPSTMTCSPVLRPPSTTQSLPLAPPSLI